MLTKLTRIETTKNGLYADNWMVRRWKLFGVIPLFTSKTQMK